MCEVVVMDIALISGAYKNAGDYLIEERCRRLLLHLVTGAKVHRIVLNEVKNNLDYLNEMDAICFHGGPIYSNSLERIFMGKVDPNKLLPKIMVIGGGWYGKYAYSGSPYRYKFTDYTLNFWKYVDKTGYGLGCRDLYTVKTLQNKNLTGCPAWYDIPHLKITKLSNDFNSIGKIFVSEPANKENFKLLFELIKYLKTNFNNAQINIVVHRDKNVFLKRTDKMHLNWYEKNQIDIIDITNSYDGFSIYNDSDLHIGFRVHAHIYNLSIRNRSILIEEDGRGAGVNQALGLIGIKAYDDRYCNENKFLGKITKLFGFANNVNLINDVDAYLEVLSDTGDMYINNSFTIMQKYYLNMEKHIVKLNEII